MVAVQNLKGDLIQLILSRKGGGGMYLVNATPTIARGGVSLSEFTHSSSYFWVITILPFDNLYRRAYFVMHTFLVNTFFV